MSYLSGGKGTALDGQVGVSADRRQLLGNFEGNVLVAGRRLGGRVLVLGDGSNLGVDSSLVAENALETDTASVALEGAEQDGVGLAFEITRSLRVAEGLVGNDLLQAVEVGDVGRAFGSSLVTEETKDGILDGQGVVELQIGVDDSQDSFMGVLLRNLALAHLGVEADFASRRTARKGNDRSLVLHDVSSIEYSQFGT